MTSDLNRAARDALDTAGISWTVDLDDTLAAAGCHIALNYATGLPEIWQNEIEADVDGLADALADVHVAPGAAPS